MKGKLHLPLLSFLSGVLYAHIPHSWPLLAVSLLWFLFFTRFRFLAFLMLLSFFLGVFTYSSSVSLVPLAERPFYGEILSAPAQNGNKTSFSFETSDTLKYEAIHFAEEAESSFLMDVDVEARCTLMAEFKEYPAATNPGQFDFSGYMDERGYKGQLLLEQSEDMECEGSSWKQVFHDYRNALVDRVMDKSHASLNPWIEALVFGNRQGLDERVTDFFREVGMTHILAISGLHVGLFAGMVYLLLYRTGFISLSQVKMIVFLTLPLFAFVAGGAPSVLRASLTAVIVLAFSAFKVRPSMTDVLAAVAIILLLLQPELIYHPGFQFSFAVTFSLLLSSNFFQEGIHPLALSLRVSFVAQLAILPLQLHYFHGFSPLSVFFNVIFVPYFTIVFIPFIFLVVLAVFFLPDFMFMAMSQFGASMHTAFIDIVVETGGMINVQWLTGAFPVEWFPPYYLCFFLMMIFLEKRNLHKGFLFGVALVCVLMVYSVLPYFSDRGTVTFLDVGQGDSAVIELPYRKGVIMIDAAGLPVFQEDPAKIADTVLLPFLRSKGIAGVDALFVTHNDTDHNGSVPRLVEEDAFDALFLSAYDDSDYETEATPLKKGDRYEIGGYVFDILGPENNREDKNDNSLIIITELGGEKWMFTGDISEEVEKEVVDEYGRMNVDYLKVSHHGSKTSTSEAFMDAFHPEVGVISAGRNNRYGHPHPTVVDRLNTYGTEIWRTDVHGAVSVYFSDKQVWSVEGFVTDR
ncbi:DNA internalization-related competence protein ComEC/Rec2 [Salimicrobium sp. PL1-032A]|uniref:DNA internalization-related competence protein ComEC/Rec2 n=1 Tax=Salimicrobium sp. PL1-032A TaxID=3095364 RepID=UPI003260DF0C